MNETGPDQVLGRLNTALAARGVAARWRRRIVAEADDHLRDGDVDRFGDVDAVAQSIVDVLATGAARRSAVASFAALAPGAAVFVADGALVNAAGGWPDIFAGALSGFNLVAVLVTVLAAQVSLVAGVLALSRRFFARGLSVLPRGEAELIAGRARVALASGAIALAGLAASTLNVSGEMPLWWTVAIGGGVAATVPGLLAAARVARSAAEVARNASGTLHAPDVRAELHLERLRAWQMCALVASAVGLAALVAGWNAESSLVEGLIRGAFETVAVVACWLALGRRLGLRPTA